MTQVLKTIEPAKANIVSFANYPDLVNIQQLESMLGIGGTLAYKLVKNGKIKSIKIGREYKIPKLCVIDYITNNTK